MPINRVPLSNPELTQFNELSNIADGFARLSDSTITPKNEKLKDFLLNPKLAISKELLKIADSLDLLNNRGNFKGDKGDTGNTGEIGKTGPQGIEGNPGLAGLPGKDGKDGVRGKDGLAGPQGDRGVVGAAGKDGIAGPQGATGPAGSPDTAEQILAKLKTLKEDDRFINNHDLNRAITILDQRTSFLINRINTIATTPGPQGATGPAGGQGSQGSQGSGGAQGSQGSAGATGPQGATGPVNATTGTYTPTRSAEVNMDTNVTMSEAQYLQVGNTVNVSGRFTANPTLTATSTSFEITLPVASNIGAAEDVAGVAFCGTIAAMGAEIIGVAANDTAKIFWISSDPGNNTWSYIFSYQII